MPKIKLIKSNQITDIMFLLMPKHIYIIIPLPPIQRLRRGQDRILLRHVYTNNQPQLIRTKRKANIEIIISLYISLPDKQGCGWL